MNFSISFGLHGTSSLKYLSNLLSVTETEQLISHVRHLNGQSDLDDEIVKIITMLSSGDMKKVINFTQTISALSEVNIETFHQIFNIPPIKVLEQIRETRQHKVKYWSV
jgi:DNA polymerase III delta prime subunit